MVRGKSVTARCGRKGEGAAHHISKTSAHAAAVARYPARNKSGTATKKAHHGRKKDARIRAAAKAREGSAREEIMPMRGFMVVPTLW